MFFPNHSRFLCEKKPQTNVIVGMAGTHSKRFYTRSNLLYTHSVHPCMYAYDRSMLFFFVTIHGLDDISSPVFVYIVVLIK